MKYHSGTNENFGIGNCAACAKICAIGETIGAVMAQTNVVIEKEWVVTAQTWAKGEKDCAMTAQTNGIGEMIGAVVA